MNFDAELELFVGEATPSQAIVYARWPGSASADYQ